MTKKAKDYRLPETTTMETLEMHSAIRRQGPSGRALLQQGQGLLVRCSLWIYHQKPYLRRGNQADGSQRRTVRRQWPCH